MGRDNWYLRELAVPEGISYDMSKAQSPTDPDEVSVHNPRGRNLNHLPWTDPVLKHLQYIGDTIMGNTVPEVFEKGKTVVQIPLKAAIKQSKVPEPAQEVQFLRIK